MSTLTGPVSTTRPRSQKKRGSRAKAPKALSRTRQPEGLALETWQLELRRQFGAAQKFRLTNLGRRPVFSEFEVANAASGGVYRVAIRGEQPGENFCSCADFATNTLGTCKHVEFTLAKLRKKRGGAKALREGFQPKHSEVYLAYGAEREVRFRPGVNCPKDLARLAARHFDAEGRLLPESFARFEKFVSQARSLDDELQVYDDALAFIAQVRDGAERRELLGRAFSRGVRSAAWKKLLKLELFDYQKEGALFAASAGRALIGDEMGLGKTMQALAAVEIMARHLGVERVLIVCPTSLKHQWEREITRATERSAVVIGGGRKTREERFARESFFKITNYDTLHRDLDLVATWSPELIILDEAQRIKNWSTRAARTVKRLESPYALVLTGTPLENRLEELVSIVQFLDQHRLGPTFRFLHEHQIKEGETGRVVGYKNLDQIGRTLAPLLIRRRKSEVLKQLPGRTEKNFFVPMTALQQKYHDENQEIVARIVQKWQRHGFLSETDQRRLMICLQNMRMSCDSTYLLDHKSDYGDKAREFATLLGELFENPAAKVVVFSQWTRMHELVERQLAQRRWGHVFFHGGVESEKRKLLVDRFREDPACRSFLSTDAGGVGLNLQHAAVVVNLDLPWNPAVLEQRIGRVHRLGQTQPVQVFNFVAQGTIEEGMLSVLRFKKSLFAGALDGGEKEVFLGGSRLKRFMQSVQEATGAIPAAELAEPAENETEPQAVGAASAAETVRRPANESTGGSQAVEVGEPALAAENGLAGLLRQGLMWLETLAQGAHAGPGASAKGGLAATALRVERDPAHGGPYLKLPLPPPAVVQEFLGALQKLLAAQA